MHKKQNKNMSVSFYCFTYQHEYTGITFYRKTELSEQFVKRDKLKNTNRGQSGCRGADDHVLSL